MAKGNRKPSSTGWVTMSRKQRERANRGRDLGTLLAEVMELQKAHNILSVHHHALREFIVRHLHTHPTQTDAGILLVSNGNATPPRPITVAELEELIAETARKLLADVEGGPTSPTPTSGESTPEFETPQSPPLETKAA